MVWAKLKENRSLKDLLSTGNDSLDIHVDLEGTRGRGAWANTLTALAAPASCACGGGLSERPPAQCHCLPRHSLHPVKSRE